MLFPLFFVPPPQRDKPEEPIGLKDKPHPDMPKEMKQWRDYYASKADKYGFGLVLPLLALIGLLVTLIALLIFGEIGWFYFFTFIAASDFLLCWKLGKNAAYNARMTGHFEGTAIAYNELYGEGNWTAEYADQIWIINEKKDTEC